MKSLMCLFFLLLVSVTFCYSQEWRTDIPVHDPVIIKQDSLYYVFCTGRGIAMWSSYDKIHWKSEKPVFTFAPAWSSEVFPEFRNGEWAPDISYHNGVYYLYYAISVFGKNTSAIGVATNTTLHTNDPAYKWVDHGKVIQSFPGKTNWNAIDPNLILDKDGTPYLTFGSFWGGLKIIRLKKDFLHVNQPLNDLPTLATRKKNFFKEKNDSPDTGNPVNAGDNAIEAPFIFRKGKFFYLFASIDYCCKGPLSTYKMIVGRSKKLMGPYFDKSGISLTNGGGTILLAGDTHWYGVGHNGIGEFDGEDYIVFHGYDAKDNGKPKLRLEKLAWNKGWPEIKTY